MVTIKNKLTYKYLPVKNQTKFKYSNKSWVIKVQVAVGKSIICKSR